MKNKLVIIAAVVALLIGGGIGFFAGTKYQQGKDTSSNQTPGNLTFQQRAVRGGRFGGANGMVVRGQIISSDSNSITVKLPDGSTKIIILSSSTMIGKTTTGSTTDLTNGATITAIGSTNSDGSITAQNVQIGNGMMFGPRPSGSPMPSGAPQGY